MNAPLISIVMPVYNALPYLEQAIQSIYAQTITDWELVAVDDCSTDGSHEFLKSIDDPRVRVLRNQENMGHSFTCNVGISSATGRYIARMDADDMMLPTRLEKQLSMLQGNPHLDVVGCGLFRMRNNGIVVAVHRPPPKHHEIARLFSGAMSFVYGPSFQLTNGAMFGCTMWFQRWKYDATVPYAQDFDLICRSRGVSMFGNIPEPLYIYRVGSGGTSSWSNQMKAVFYKAKSIAKHAFLQDMTEATLGVATLFTRPAAYALVKLLVHGPAGTNRLIGNNVTSQDLKTLKEGLEQIAGIDIPLNDGAS